MNCKFSYTNKPFIDRRHRPQYTIKKSYMAHDVNCNNHTEGLIEVIGSHSDIFRNCARQGSLIQSINTKWYAVYQDVPFFQWSRPTIKVISPTAKLFKCRCHCCWQRRQVCRLSTTYPRNNLPRFSLVRAIAQCCCNISAFCNVCNHFAD